MTFPVLFPIPVLKTIAQLTATSEVTTDTSIYTFSSIAMGTANGNKFNVVAVLGRAATANVSSVVVGGVTGTLLVKIDGTSTPTAFAIVHNPVNTTGNVVVTMSATADRCGLGVWSLISSRGTSVATTSFTAGSVGSGTIFVAGGGVVLAAASMGAGIANQWTGLTEVFGWVGEAADQFTGAQASPSSSTTLPFQVGTGTVVGGVAASWS